MKAKVIKTESDYQAALAYVETLMDAPPGSQAEEELELFAMLIETYEEVVYPIGLPDPIAAIKFRMEQQELTPQDLEPYLGAEPIVSEVLRGQRPLSLSMIQALHTELGIPAEILLQRSHNIEFVSPSSQKQSEQPMPV